MTMWISGSIKINGGKFGGMGNNDYLCYTTMTRNMIENVVKKYFKDKIHTIKAMGYIVSYKINVNVRQQKNMLGTINRIDLNVKIVSCKMAYNSSNVFGDRRRSTYIYNDIREVVREDLNTWFGKVFSTYFYRNCYTRLCNNVNIGLNKFTYK